MSKFFLALLFFVPMELMAEIIHSERSLYRNIIVEDTDELRCLKFNVKRIKSSQSCFIKTNPQRLVFNYTKLILTSLLLVENPKNVLIIGLGGGTLSNTLHQLYPQIKIDNVEIDPAVIKVARKYFGFFESELIKSKVQDGRLFVKRALVKKQQYDLIILDAFNGDYIPEHLLTLEFLQEIKQLLSNKGVLAANTFSISDLYRHESATYHAAFGDFYNVRNNKNSNRIILTLPLNMANSQTIEVTLAQRTKDLSAKLAVFDIDIHALKSSMSSTKNAHDWPEDTRLLTDQYSPANLLNH